ncbi:MAG: hypothetical protein FDZ75_02675 [Actinobacteria bacterium]|nr:MAG: hypothetical protein FDZ75_02675 [Actinomycetota bacterium]
MTKYLLRAFILSLAMVAMSAAPALAYRESVTSTNPSSTPAYSCPTCHSLEAGATSPTVAPRTVPTTWTWDTEAGTNVGSRKGPHGGYTPGTQKCVTCHTVHGAPAGSVALLPQASISAVCYTCHDGTGGGGVYGVIKQRTGFDPAQLVGGQTQGGVHRIDTTATVPGGATNGGSITTSFSGDVVGGYPTMTCTDCHSPHNSNTVKPFLGDRKRSTLDTSWATTKTNRLLKVRVTSSTTTATEYGSDWCEGCHKGRHSQTSTMGNHPAADSTTAPGWNYNRVSKLTGFGTSAVTTGGLGGDNFGYVMPEPRGLQPYPICQQCHEDARTVGDVVQFQVSSPAETFTISVDGSPTGNPRFQNFPHESQNDAFLIESYDDLCLNCHVSP